MSIDLDGAIESSVLFKKPKQVSSPNSSPEKDVEKIQEEHHH